MSLDTIQGLLTAEVTKQLCCIITAEDPAQVWRSAGILLFQAPAYQRYSGRRVTYWGFGSSPSGECGSAYCHEGFKYSSEVCAHVGVQQWFPHFLCWPPRDGSATTLNAPAGIDFVVLTDLFQLAWHYAVCRVMHVLDGCRDRRTAEKAGDSLERWFVFVYTRIKYEIESCAFTMLHMQTWKWWVEPSKARVRLVRAFCWSSTLADVSTHRRVTSFHLSAGSYLQRQCGVHTAFLSFCFARVSKGLASHPVVCIFWSN